tara:strand:- start:2017 stop:2229 length:213 start_codon:yes stop_codon:yes gene_type:complete
MNELEMGQAGIDGMAKPVQGGAQPEAIMPAIAPVAPIVDPLVQATNTNFSPQTQFAANNIFGTTGERGLV